jgi:3-oxoadipate enol-lactonase
MKTTVAKVLSRDGVDLAYERTPGPADTRRVIYIHSLALDRSIWNPVVAELSGHADQLTVDCRGHGQSGRAGMPYSIEQFADDIADVLDRVGWTSATVVGCSMGGCVAQAFAALYPSRTEAAVFVDTTAWYGSTAPDDWAQRAQAGREGGLAALLPFQLERWFGDDFRSTRPELMAALADVFTANDTDSYASTCTMLGATDLRASAQDVTCPSMVVVGEDDHATPVPMARDLAERVGASRLLVVPGTRHLTPLENPTAVTEALHAVWSTIDAVRP